MRGVVRKEVIFVVVVRGLVDRQRVSSLAGAKWRLDRPRPTLSSFHTNVLWQLIQYTVHEVWFDQQTDAFFGLAVEVVRLW